MGNCLQNKRFLSSAKNPTRRSRRTSSIARRAGARKTMKRQNDKQAGITEREREVLTWAARGLSSRDTGLVLDIAKRTVDEHVQTAARKLGAANKTQAVAIAIRDQLIQVDPA